MKEIRCWRLESKAEDFNSLCARFSTETEAQKAAPAAGGYGPSIKPETIKIYDQATEWKPALDEEAKVSGLAKLNEREKKALGISG